MLSDTTADQAIANTQAVDEAQAKIELLQAQVEALQEAIEQVKAGLVKATPSWKGAPQWEDKDAGFTFKPKGLIQLDAGYVGFPDGNQLRGTRRRSQLPESRVEQPRPPSDDRRRWHAPRRLPLQRRVQPRSGRGGL